MLLQEGDGSVHCAIGDEKVMANVTAAIHGAQVAMLFIFTVR